MAANRLFVQKIKEGLYLKWEDGIRSREIARSYTISRSTVAEYLRRSKKPGLIWPLRAEVDENEPGKRFFRFFLEDRFFRVQPKQLEHPG